MGRSVLGLTFFACVLSLAACADSTAPAPAKTVPTGPKTTRYILASGDTPPAGCRDLGNGLWLCDDEGTQLQSAGAPAPKPDDDDSGN